MTATKFDMKKISQLPTVNDLIDNQHGKLGTPERDAFNVKARSWYYAE